jgi:hypothetical protein
MATNPRIGTGSERHGTGCIGEQAGGPSTVQPVSLRDQEKRWSPQCCPRLIPGGTANRALPVCWMYSLSASLAPSFCWREMNWLGSFMKAIAHQLPLGHLGRRVAPVGQEVPQRGPVGAVDHREGGKDQAVLGRRGDARLMGAVEGHGDLIRGRGRPRRCQKGAGSATTGDAADGRPRPGQPDATEQCTARHRGGGAVLRPVLATGQRTNLAWWATHGYLVPAPGLS